METKYGDTRLDTELVKILCLHFDQSRIQSGVPVATAP